MLSILARWMFGLQSPFPAGAMFIYQALGSHWVRMPLDRASWGQDLG